MRRSVLAIIGTVAGTALLVGAKVGTHPPDAAALDAPDPAASGAPTTSAAPAGAAPQSSGTGGQAPAKGGLKNGTFTGAGTPAQRYETVTVTITVSGGKVTVASGSCGDASGQSRSICQGALPKLQQETLTTQNAKIATVSGATYTSGAYRSSLQSALDRAKA